jgi:hypothetical protein
VAEKKNRSVFWIVSTHVLTSGFVMPLLAFIVFYVITMNAGTAVRSFGPLAELGLLLALMTLGYVGGVLYSLSYLTKVAIMERPLACITPSIITFSILGVLFLAADIAKSWQRGIDIMATALLAFYYAGITVLFAVFTQRGFRRIAASQEPRGFPVEPVQK